MQPKRRHPRGSVIAYIWIGTFVAGFLLAIFFQDDDPNTDEGAGAGGLILIGGTALTITYVALAKRLNSRIATSIGVDDDSAVVVRTRWVRRNRGPLAAGAGAVVVILVAGALAPSPHPDSQRTESMPNTDPTHVSSKADLVAAIRAAASEGSGKRRITSVDCIDPVDTSETLLFSCAVTFEGPACQLWLAGGMDDPEPVALGDPTDGRRGWADEHMAHCE